jgi:hypothetical protein
VDRQEDFQGQDLDREQKQVVRIFK